MKKSKYFFIVQETVEDEIIGDSCTEFLKTTDLIKAVNKYNEELNKVKHEEFFFLKEFLDDAIEGTHTPSIFDWKVQLPLFQVEDNDGRNRYELTIAVCEYKSEHDRYAIVIDRRDYVLEGKEDEMEEWNDFYPTLFLERDDAERKLKSIIKEEFNSLVASRGNEDDYILDENTNIICDCETGKAIPVAHYSIVEFKDYYEVDDDN